MDNPVTPIDKNTADKEIASVYKEGYIHRALVAIDVCINVVLLNGRPDETISSHSARAALEGKTWGIWMCKFLNIFQKDHGEYAMLADEGRAQIIEKVEKEKDNG